MDPQLQSLNIKREPIAQVVYEAIRDAIVDKRLSPGAMITEVGLARMLNVSKTPVREAMLRLRELHLVEADSNRRLHVIRPSRETIASAYEARMILEGGAAALAAARASDTQREALNEAAAESVRYAEAGDTDLFRRWDRIFHTAIADATSSPHMATLMRNSLLLTSALRARDAPIANNAVGCSHEHLGIAEAICEQDQERARQLASGHIRHVSRNVLSAFEQKGDAQGQPA